MSAQKGKHDQTYQVHYSRHKSDSRKKLTSGCLIYVLVIFSIAEDVNIRIFFPAMLHSPGVKPQIQKIAYFL